MFVLVTFNGHRLLFLLLLPRIWLFKMLAVSSCSFRPRTHCLLSLAASNWLQFIFESSVMKQQALLSEVFRYAMISLGKTNEVEPSGLFEELCSFSVFCSWSCLFICCCCCCCFQGDEAFRPRRWGQEGCRVHQIKSHRSGVYGWLSVK